MGFFFFNLSWILFSLALCLQFSCVNCTLCFLTCPTCSSQIRNIFQIYVLLLTCKLNLTLSSTPTEQTFPNYLPLLLFFCGSNVCGFCHSCALFVVQSSVLIHLLPFPCFFSKCCHARNLSFSVECASNHSSFNMFWLSFCVFSHVGSSCLLQHSGILRQQVILFHIGKTPCEYVNLSTWFWRIVQRQRNDILKFFGIDFSLACVDLCWNCKCFFF